MVSLGPALATEVVIFYLKKQNSGHSTHHANLTASINEEGGAWSRPARLHNTEPCQNQTSKERSNLTKLTSDLHRHTMACGTHSCVHQRYAKSCIKRAMHGYHSTQNPQQEDLVFETTLIHMSPCLTNLKLKKAR